MKRIYLAVIISVISFCCLHAQPSNTIFLSQGKIEYEKKLNVYSQMDEGDSWTELEKKTTAQYKTSYFDLLFTRSKTLYKPGKEAPSSGSNMNFVDRPAEDNVVYSDLDAANAVSQKKVFEQIFLVQDSTRSIRWKITDEMRTIAGFSCRRANAVILDSVYVVAFYTDEILTTGGPESFSGLPGMILGVALPHQHVTWFATKVQAVPVAESEVIPPQKGKKINNAALKQTLQETLKNFWNKKQGQQIMLFSML